MAKASDVLLKIGEFLIFALIAGGGLTACVSLGWTGQFLKDQCVLYSSMWMSMKTVGSNTTLVIDAVKTVWGKPSQCSYCTFSMALVVCYAIIGIWFYIFLTNWNQRYKRPNRGPQGFKLLAPSVFANVMIWICAVVSLAMINTGRDIWCHTIQVSLSEECNVVSKYEWENMPGGRRVYNLILVALIANMVVVGTLIIKTVLEGIRLYFSLQKAMLWKKQRGEPLLKEEQPETVTESESLETIPEIDA